MLKVKIDKQEPTELFEQVAAEIRRAIADGEAKPGRAASPGTRPRGRPRREHEHRAALAPPPAR